MCFMSVVMDYGRNHYPRREWTFPGVNRFMELAEKAKEFDKVTNQPDCVDPEKEKFLQGLENWIAEQRAKGRR